jgi:acyl-CoA hydrolase
MEAETSIIEPREVVINHLVKSEDLNHHRTLFAGRSAEWFVESGFIAVASILQPENVICAQIHGMKFMKPVKPGNIVCFRSKIAYAGTSSCIVYVKGSVIEQATRTEQKQVEGFITFVHVGADGRPLPHNIVVTPATDEDVSLMEEAMKLKDKR